MKQQSFFSKYRLLVLTFMLMFMMLGGAFAVTTQQTARNVAAGAEVVGDPGQANVRALITSDGTDRVRRVIYFKMAPYSTGGANTPVASGKVCELAGTLHYAQVNFTGTLAGAAPTLVIKWQNSKDNGVTWSDVGTWTTINATVTPASQSQSVGDLASNPYFNGTTTVNSTATVYGDCWRVTYTMGAGGAGNFSVTGMEK